MSEWRYRLRRLVFGPPRWSVFTPADRDLVLEMKALLIETADPDARVIREWSMPSGRTAVSREPADGIAEELAFRRYARRSGEHVR